MMVFNPINLLYFAIVGPLVVLTSLILRKRDREKDRLLIVGVLCLLLFAVRIFLVLFADTIGIMPYLEPDILFYTLLAIFGVVFTVFYVLKVEKQPLPEVGWQPKDLKRSVLYGVLGYLPLIAFLPVVMLLTGIEISLMLTWEKVVLGIEFGFILGGFYEEVMFRGVIQNHLSNLASARMTIISTALLFTATHLWYLPFTGYGIYYWFVLLMAFVLSILRWKCDLISSAILHGGIVFVLIIAV